MAVITLTVDEALKTEFLKQAQELGLSPVQLFNKFVLGEKENKKKGYQRRKEEILKTFSQIDSLIAEQNPWNNEEEMIAELAEFRKEKSCKKSS